MSEKKSKYYSLVDKILSNIGGKSNIAKYEHCMTRLRFKLNDESLVNTVEIKKIAGVLGVNVVGGQYQVIIGPHVSDVFKELDTQLKSSTSSNEVGNFGTTQDSLQKKKFNFSFNGLIDVIAALFTPIIGVLAGAGLFSGFFTIITTYANVDQQTKDILGMISNAAINMLPILIAYTAAQKFGVNPAISISVVGCLVSAPMILAKAAKIETLYLWGMSIPVLSYAGAIFPPLLAVFTLKWLMWGLDKILPKSLQMIFSALIAVTIMIPMTLIVFGPIGNYIGIGLAWLIQQILGWQRWLAIGIYGFLRPLQIAFGLHYPFMPIMMENIAKTGFDYLSAGSLIGTVAQAGAILGIFLLCKKSENKQVTGAAAISAAIGITEPALYGGILKYKTSLLATMLTGFVGGSIVGGIGARTHVFGMSAPISLANFFEADQISVFIWLVITMVSTYAATTLLVLLLGINEDATDNKQYYQGIKWWNLWVKGKVWVQIYKIDRLKNKDLKKRIKQKVALTPIGKGELFKLTEIGVDDTDYQGYGIKIKSHEMYSPINGTITKIENNVITISSGNIKVLVSIGTPEFELTTDSYKLLCQVNDKVTIKQPLAEFNKEIIKKNKLQKYGYVYVLETGQNHEVMIKKDYGSTMLLNSNLLVIPQTTLKGDLYEQIHR